MFRKLACALMTALALELHAARVVINEIMYHPAEGQDALQYIELFNAGNERVDVSGWRISGGVKFTFPANTAIEGGSYLVVARDPVAFQRVYPNAALVEGSFSGRLKHKGEKIELVDGSNGIVEKVRFADRSPWPAGADGYGPSLERICVDGSAEEPRNWAAAHASEARRSLGSPGEANSVASAMPLPVVQNVRWPKLAAPGEVMQVTAEASGGGTAALKEVVLEYQLIRPGRPGTLNETPMQRVSGDERLGTYRASIPEQPEGTLVRFSIKASDVNDAVRMEPGAGEPRPAFASWVMKAPERASVPLISIINSESIRGRSDKFAPAMRAPKEPGKSALLYVPPEGEIELFDFVQVRRRAGGWKVHFLRDQLLGEMSSINLVFEGSPRWVLAEHLSYEMYRKAGLKIQKSGHARVMVDGREAGYHLMVEQPNKTFLGRTGRDDSGNLYKVLWFGNDIVDKHEKKTNPGSGHEDIVSLVNNLRRKSGAAQWAYINEQIEVDAFVNYYAVNMCIQNWDGFFNNHFVYHDLKPGGKWDIIPWDEDKTWGDYDGAPSDYSWYDMPLTSGSSSDRPVRSGWFGGGGPFGGVGWWRPPGVLSGPLLSNAEFRQRMQTRLRELCMTTFSPEKFGPVIEALQRQLRPEVERKARAQGQDTSWAVKQFDSDIASFQRQLVNRRKYILANLK